MNKLFFIIYFLLENTWAQDIVSNPKESFFFYDIMGKKTIIIIIGIIFFFFSYKNSVKLFEWIENQTFGTRDYILNKCDLLFWEIEPMKVTYILLYLTFGNSIIAICIFSLFGMFSIGLIVGFFLMIIGWKLPRPFMDYLVNRRIKEYEDQMVDGLNLLSNGLRAGLSVPQSLGLVVDELPSPISQEFGVILQQAKIGVPLDEAFNNLAVRIPTEDNDMFVASVGILRETGGNLAEVFDTISGVIRERIRLKQKIETYIAQGKMQGGVIASMPTAMFLYFFSQDPDSISLLFTNPVGIILLLVAITLNILGVIAMWKVVQIKV